MTNALLINNRSPEDVVWQILALDGYLAPAVAERGVERLAYGAGVFGSAVEVKPRTVTAVLDVRADSLPHRTEILTTLKRRMPALVEIQSADVPGRVLTAHLADMRVEYFDAAHGHPVCSVTLVWTAPDGAWRDIEPTVRALSSSRVVCPMGTGTSAARVTLKGAATAVVDPVVIIRNAAGDEVSRLTLAGSLTTNMAMVIDGALHSLALYDAGVLQTGTSAGDNWLVSGTFPVLSGEDGSTVTVELSAASGTPTGILLYTRSW